MSLRTAGKTVTLIMCRPDPENLPPLPQLVGRNTQVRFAVWKILICI